MKSFHAARLDLAISVARLRSDVWRTLHCKAQADRADGDWTRLTAARAAEGPQ